MSSEPKITDLQKQWHGSLTEYVVGFILSIILTVISYLSVVEHYFSSLVLAILIVALGIIQAITQLLCFLHIHREDRPRWNLVVFSFMLSTLLILVLGTMWIMYNLDERVMPEMTNSQPEGFHD